MYKLFIRHLLIGLFMLFLISCGVSKTTETAPPKAPASPKPGQCTACHEDKEVIPQNHVDTDDMTADDCDSCHEGTTSLINKIPLSHMHQLEGISCRGCHEDPASAEAADSTVCKNCHNDTKALYNATSGEELNPHYSPHEGGIPDCNKCHHQHKKSENYCTQCHVK
jgi:hypothetical protein